MHFYTLHSLTLISISLTSLVSLTRIISLTSWVTLTRIISLTSWVTLIISFRIVVPRWTWRSKIRLRILRLTWSIWTSLVSLTSIDVVALEIERRRHITISHT